MRAVVLAAMALLLVTGSMPAAGWVEDFDPVVVREAGGVSEEVANLTETAAALLDAERTVIHLGTLRMLAVTRGDHDVQRPDPGFGYPMAVMAVEGRRAEQLLGRDLARVLRAGEVVMSRLSAGMRGAREGDQVTLEGWNGTTRSYTVGAVASDEVLEWNELVISTSTAGELGFERPAKVLLWDPGDLGVLRLVLDLTLPGGPVEYRMPGEVPANVDATLPLVMVKRLFGEFSYRPTGVGDRIEVDDEWFRANIVEVDLPNLGLFRCHRRVVPYIRAALADIEAMRLDWLIDTDDFQVAGGCYNARLMRGGNKGFALSRHSWGAAIDLNPTTNPYGGPVRLEPRIGEAFRRWGFAWGAGWLEPDGMHFEWTHVPLDDAGNICAAIVLPPPPSAFSGSDVYARTGRCSVR